MKPRYYCLTFLFLIAFLSRSFAQDNTPLNNIIGQLKKYSTENPIEKVHLHLDKSYYAVGDDIWFKAYVVDALAHQPSMISKAIYVELINESDVVKQQVKLPLMTGLSWGSFRLADSLHEGNYRIRAYTQWMRNYGTDYFYDKTIRIGNSWANKVFTNTTYAFSKEGTGEKVDANITYTDASGMPYTNMEVSYEVQLDARNIAKGKGKTNDEGKLHITFVNDKPFMLKSGNITTKLMMENKQVATKLIPIQATNADIAVQFFAEGGTLLNGVRNRIAFKATNNKGQGVNVKGYVIDSDKKTMVDFNSEYLGMGMFGISPEAGKNYSAVVQFEDGSQKQIALPKADDTGYSLLVNNLDKDSLTIKVSAQSSIAGEVKVVAQSGGNVYYASKSAIDKNVLLAKVPKSRFPSGVLQITLFDTSNQPVCERLVFINNPSNQLAINIGTDKTDYDKREKVALNLNVKDNDGKPVQGSFSVAVTDVSSIAPDELNESNILTSLLLSADIKGYIEKPNYYFQLNDEAHARNLDLLMMTQGWRRFTWKQVLSGAYPKPTLKAEDGEGLSISGHVTRGGKPVANGKVLLLASSGKSLPLDTLTNALGQFNFDKLYFSDSTKFVVQARTEKNKKYVDIELDRITDQVVTKNKNMADLDVNVNGSMMAYLNTSKKYFDVQTQKGMLGRNIMLNEVKVVEKKQPAKNSSNLNGAGNADAVITADKLSNCVTLSQCLQGRVAGVQIMNGIAYSSRSMSLSGRVPMQIILDGMYMEPDFLDQISPNDVETVEILKGGATTSIYGSRGGGGVIIITTKRGGGSSNYNNYAPGIVSYIPKGFAKLREFYSPNYADPKTNTSSPDLRSTILWAPHVITDKEGKGGTSYFNADGAGTYRVVVEGIDAFGNIGRKVYTYQVK